VLRGSLEQSIARIRYGLRGIIPDGMLFRISEITTDVPQAFALQDEFVEELLKNVSPEAKKVLIGTK